VTPKKNPQKKRENLLCICDNKHPDDIYEDVEHGTLIAIKKVNGNSIILAYKMENNKLKL
jgi:hypothetical protein